MRITARDAALQVLELWRRNSAWSDSALNSVLQKIQLDPREAALCTRIVYGVVQNSILCDYSIAHYLTGSIKKIEPKVLDILRIGSYQILMMDKIPPSAAVNESVKLCRSHGFARAAGLVNAVLRKMSESGMPPIQADSPLEKLSICYSHPLWMVERFNQILGFEETEALLAANNQPVAVACRVNTERVSEESLYERLRHEGYFVQPGPLEGLFSLEGVGAFSSSKIFQEGLFFVQDYAAALAVAAASAAPGMRVLDGCAAPGGKAFSAALQMKNRGHIIACDLYDSRLARVVSGAARLSLPIIEAVCQDSTVFRPEWENVFDIVLADVPCSGLGVIRKKPEIRYKDYSQIKSLPALQLAILQNLSRYVRPGGILLYSTCTILPEENEEVIRAFLDNAVLFEADPLPLPKKYCSPTVGSTTLWPQRHGTDGFFICRLKKRL